MKSSRFLRVTGLVILLLGLATAMSALPGQDSRQAADQKEPSLAIPGTGSAHKDPSANWNACAEQFQRQARIFEQQMRQELANMKGRMKEAGIGSPELERWQALAAQLEGQKSEFGSRMEELSSRAQEAAEQASGRARQMFEEGPGAFLVSPEEAGWLGVEIGEVTPEKAKDLKLASVRGVVVLDVEPDGPAAKAGLKENDIITEFDGQAVEGTVQFRRLVQEAPPGRSVSLVIWRNGSNQNLSVEMGDRSASIKKKMRGRMREFGHAHAFSMPNFDFHFDTPEMMDWRTPVLGMSAEDLSGQLGAYFGAPNNSGVLVREVRPGTPAEKAGLKAGDVIVKLDDQPIASLADLRERLGEKSDQKSVNLGILRKGSEITVPVLIEKPHPMDPAAHIIHRAQM